MSAEPEKLGVIYNPKAGTRKVQKRWKEIKEAVDLVLRNIRLGATIDGLVRKEKYELPPEAIREILFLVCIRLSVVEMGLKSNTWIL